MISISEDKFQEAINVLEKGGVIVFPTETSYGLGCDATNSKAVDRIFAIKGRLNEKGLPVLLPNVESAEEYVEFNEVARHLADQFWPGGLNIIADCMDGTSLTDLCTRFGSQSVRVSSHPIASMLVKRFGKPIVATSANVSGDEAMYHVKNVKDAFADQPDQPDYILDGGELPLRPASTTVKIVGDNVEIIRQGKIEIPEELVV